MTTEALSALPRTGRIITAVGETRVGAFYRFELAEVVDTADISATFPDWLVLAAVSGLVQIGSPPDDPEATCMIVRAGGDLEPTAVNDGDYVILDQGRLRVWRILALVESEIDGVWKAVGPSEPAVGNAHKYRILYQHPNARRIGPKDEPATFASRHALTETLKELTVLVRRDHLDTTRVRLAVYDLVAAFAGNSKRSQSDFPGALRDALVELWESTGHDRAKLEAMLPERLMAVVSVSTGERAAERTAYLGLERVRYHQITEAEFRAFVTTSRPHQVPSTFPAWLVDAVDAGVVSGDARHNPIVRTQAGAATAGVGCYIVRRPNGEYTVLNERTTLAEKRGREEGELQFCLPDDALTNGVFLGSSGLR